MRRCFTTQTVTQRGPNSKLKRERKKVKALETVVGYLVRTDGAQHFDGIIAH